MSIAEDHATLSALVMGVDEAARLAEAKWGMGRLPLLVDDELRARFERQRVKWRTALEVAYDAHVITRAMLDAATSSSAAMRRAWAALDAAATAAGHAPTPPEVWETTLRNGSVAAVVKTVADAGKVVSEGRHVAVYSLDEIANIIDALPEILTKAKVEWPGAKILPPSSDRSWVKYGDEIPFGDITP